MTLHPRICAVILACRTPAMVEGYADKRTKFVGWGLFARHLGTCLALVAAMLVSIAELARAQNTNPLLPLAVNLTAAPDIPPRLVGRTLLQGPAPAPNAQGRWCVPSCVATLAHDRRGAAAAQTVLTQWGTVTPGVPGGRTIEQGAAMFRRVGLDAIPGDMGPPNAAPSQVARRFRDLTGLTVGGENPVIVGIKGTTPKVDALGNIELDANSNPAFYRHAIIVDGTWTDATGTKWVAIRDANRSVTSAVFPTIGQRYAVRYSDFDRY
jgi:hypothetical protein